MGGVRAVRLLRRSWSNSWNWATRNLIRTSRMRRTAANATRRLHSTIGYLPHNEFEQKDTCQASIPESCAVYRPGSSVVKVREMSLLTNWKAVELPRMTKWCGSLRFHSFCFWLTLSWYPQTSCASAVQVRAKRRPQVTRPRRQTDQKYSQLFDSMRSFGKKSLGIMW